VKVLIDECVDWRLSREILGHEVKTARQMGWSTIRNGELLELAAKEFAVFITVDRNLSFQQNLPAFNRQGTLALAGNRSEGTVSVLTIKGKTVTHAGKVQLGDEKSGRALRGAPRRCLRED
jgi:Domain of unknown function (DUF5615)